jgi:hypothetical protein
VVGVAPHHVPTQQKPAAISHSMIDCKSTESKSNGSRPPIRQPCSTKAGGRTTLNRKAHETPGCRKLLSELCRVSGEAIGGRRQVTAKERRSR